ncbi:MAG: M28 family peptidase, partial [Gemmatimonadota bacterium]|nr:M28 family peptidase [Gemmatimonadota bacterium]
MRQPAGTIAILFALSGAQPLTGQDSVLERAIQGGVSEDSIGKYIRRMTERPTFPGSPFSRQVAHETFDLFEAWGWEARIDTLEIPFPRPVERTLTLGGPDPFTAKLHEPEVPGDPYTEQQDAHLETYFIYGPDGDVSAPVVYANYGLREDYDYLQQAGVSVEGQIVLVRSGRMWRGGKVQLASERGAAGVLVFSDPREQGFFDRVPYPAGPGRTQHGVERGSILNGLYPGDPSTPFEPSVQGANRLSFTAPGTSLALIPALPLSAADALPILAALEGEVVPVDWRGALPTTYRTGPSRADVHLKVTYEWGTIEIFNVVASLRGTAWADEWVVRGNHHDGWVFGAQDPHSGHSAMLEEARVLGQLARQGWRPKRTIIYASWDAEEQGVIGSTEWVEANLDHLSRHAVAYLNTDVLGPGILIASGASAFSAFATDLAREVMDPVSRAPLLERARVATQVDPHSAAFEPAGRFFDPEFEELVMAPPGYGSDHHAFVSHAGIATLNF